MCKVKLHSKLKSVAQICFPFNLCKSDHFLFIISERTELRESKKKNNQRITGTSEQIPVLTFKIKRLLIPINVDIKVILLFLGNQPLYNSSLLHSVT